VVPPAWLAHPSSEAVFRAYPKDALARGMSGRAVIQCTVTAEGKLADCQVIEERPAGKGFGEAALSLAPYFLMRPMTVDGQPMPGGKISIPIQFKQSP
jgi:protein TonB